MHHTYIYISPLLRLGPIFINISDLNSRLFSISERIDAGISDVRSQACTVQDYFIDCSLSLLSLWHIFLPDEFYIDVACLFLFQAWYIVWTILLLPWNFIRLPRFIAFGWAYFFLVSRLKNLPRGPQKCCF